jgi:hypothetical protein
MVRSECLDALLEPPPLALLELPGGLIHGHVDRRGLERVGLARSRPYDTAGTKRSRGSNDLPQRDSPIVGRYPLVPVGPKAGVQQTFQTRFGKVPILKTAARQNDLCVSHPERDSPDDLSQRVVKLRGDFARRPAAGGVSNYSFDRRAPINDEREPSCISNG